MGFQECVQRYMYKNLFVTVVLIKSRKINGHLICIVGKIFLKYAEIEYCISIKIRLTKNLQLLRKVFRYVFNCKVHDKKSYSVMLSYQKLPVVDKN